MIRRTAAGFTLIEVLIALSLILIILGIAYATYAAASGSASAFQLRMEMDRRAQVVLGLMERELRCAWLDTTPPLAITPGATPASAQLDGPPQFLIQRPTKEQPFLRLLTTNTLSNPDSPVGGLWQVEWRYDELDKTLWRRQMLRASDPSASLAWLCVARDVQQIECSASSGQEWVDRWSTKSGKGLPRAVRVKLVLADEKGGQHDYQARAYISCGGERKAQTIQMNAPGSVPVPVPRGD